MVVLPSRDGKDSSLLNWVFLCWFLFVCFLASLRDMQDQGLNLCPLQWKHKALTVGPPGNFLLVPFQLFSTLQSKGSCWNAAPGLKASVVSQSNPWLLAWGHFLPAVWFCFNNIGLIIVAEVFQAHSHLRAVVLAAVRTVVLCWEFSRWGPHFLQGIIQTIPV